MATQAKCPRCKTASEWERDVPLRKLYCRRCGGKVEQTSYQLNWPRTQVVPLFEKTGSVVYKVYV